MDTHIHHFERPPVRETVLGVQFDQLPKLRTAHFGAFWKALGADWPSISDAPEIDLQYEQLEGSILRPNFEFRLTKVAPVRAQIKNSAGDRMIQIQNGRLHYNWLHRGAEYPHYGQVKNEFEKTLVLFKEFLKQEKCGSLEFNQWEVTYVNHIAQGELWNDSRDLVKIFRNPPAPLIASEGIPLESFSCEWHFQLPNKSGRLHVLTKHGIADKKPVLVITLTARGPLQNPDTTGLVAGLDMGRKAIVSAFTSITSDTAHLHWGRTS